MHSVNYVAKLVHTRRAPSSTFFNTHLIDLFLFLCGGGVLRYLVPKWLLFLT